MTDHRFNTIMSAMVEKIREDTPWKTGNLAGTATYGKPKAHGKFEIGVSVRIAPYFHYVNSRENFPSGKPNYNYHYFQKSLEKHLEELAAEIGGTLEYEQI